MGNRPAWEPGISVDQAYPHTAQNHSQSCVCSGAAGVFAWPLQCTIPVGMMSLHLMTARIGCIAALSLECTK